MANYTTAKLTEVENQGVHFGLDENDLAIRMARVPLDCTDCGVSYLRFGPGFRQPMGHAHKRQEEIYVLVSGSGRIKVDADIVDLEPWTAVRIAPGAIRSIESGPDGAEFLAVGAPNTGPGDGVVTEGWWSE